jgi:PTH2 family peptidyl-tRNA hydrolase
MKPKMVLVVRTDLKLRRGKESAQCGHAVQYCVEYHHYPEYPNRQGYQAWADSGAAKIVVGVDSEAELLALKTVAEQSGILVWPVIDHGHTEVEPNTLTCVGFGPELPEVMDPIFGHLKLR